MTKQQENAIKTLESKMEYWEERYNEAMEKQMEDGYVNMCYGKVKAFETSLVVIKAVL